MREVSLDSANVRPEGEADISVVHEINRLAFDSDEKATLVDRFRVEGWSSVLVLGHPDYRPQFGFKPASTHGLKCTFDVSDSVFIALELEKNGLEDGRGLVEFHPLFSSF
ncbi:MAG: hypothetical protein BMS9Abin05_1626 [Rhodothermia bacterium]|nr:MAG: hypothetical protein BMS9Abin05_1626 [Rhodothermia bacterium]